VVHQRRPLAAKVMGIEREDSGSTDLSMLDRDSLVRGVTLACLQNAVVAGIMPAWPSKLRFATFRRRYAMNWRDAPRRRANRCRNFCGLSSSAWLLARQSKCGSNRPGAESKRPGQGLAPRRSSNIATRTVVELCSRFIGAGRRTRRFRSDRDLGGTSSGRRKSMRSGVGKSRSDEHNSSTRACEANSYRRSQRRCPRA